jgi:glycosyltransferase involved in cell wall biosynthesis
MHIAFLTTEYPPLPSGGIGISIRNLAHVYVKMGMRVSVIGWGPKEEFEDHGVQVHFLGETKIPKLGWYLNRRLVQTELNRMVREDGLDIVEVHDWAGVSAGMRLDCPLVIRCHGTSTYFAHLLNQSARPGVNWAERFALWGADDIVAVSQFTAETTRDLFNLKSPIHVIHNGIDTARFQPTPAHLVDPDTILYLGTLVRKKGVLDLAQIFSQVVEEIPEAQFHLVGRDAADTATGAPSTWELCKEKLSPRAYQQTTYHGVQPYERVAEFIQRAAVCVFPSYAEAFPLTWLETMACAKPVVAYDIGWASEVIQDEISGRLIEGGNQAKFASAIIDVLCNPTKQNAMGSTAMQRVKSSFSAQVVAEQNLAWYREVLDNASPK